MYNKYMKSCSSSLTFREIELKPQGESVLQSAGGLKLKGLTTPRVCKDVQELDSHMLLVE